MGVGVGVERVCHRAELLGKPLEPVCPLSLGGQARGCRRWAGGLRSEERSMELVELRFDLSLILAVIRGARHVGPAAAWPRVAIRRPLSHSA